MSCIYDVVIFFNRLNEATLVAKVNFRSIRLLNFYERICDRLFGTEYRFCDLCDPILRKPRSDLTQPHDIRHLSFIQTAVC